MTRVLLPTKTIIIGIRKLWLEQQILCWDLYRSVPQPNVGWCRGAVHNLHCFGPTCYWATDKRRVLCGPIWCYCFKRILNMSLKYWDPMETPLCSILLFTRLALSGGVSECGSLLQCPLLSVPRWLQWDKQQLPLKNVHWFKLISAANICSENFFVHI